LPGRMTLPASRDPPTAMTPPEIDGEHIVRQVEYWPTPYGPLPGREDLTRPIERIP
jgi:hypothetical protein